MDELGMRQRTRPNLDKLANVRSAPRLTAGSSQDFGGEARRRRQQKEAYLNMLHSHTKDEPLCGAYLNRFPASALKARSERTRKRRLVETS